MRDVFTTRSRGQVLGTITACGAVLWLVGVALGTTTRAQEPANFRGGAPSQVDATAIRTLRLRFPAGTRSNWHRHSHGQLLMAETGKGRTQNRGGVVTEDVEPGTEEDDDVDGAIERNTSVLGTDED